MHNITIRDFTLDRVIHTQSTTRTPTAMLGACMDQCRLSFDANESDCALIVRVEILLEPHGYDLMIQAVYENNLQRYAVYSA